MPHHKVIRYPSGGHVLEKVIDMTTPISSTGVKVTKELRGDFYPAGHVLEKVIDMATPISSTDAKAMKQRRGDFIHGANWALKYMRERGQGTLLAPSTTVIGNAAAERFVIEPEYRKITTEYGSAEATENGVKLTQRNGQTLLLTNAEVDAMEVVAHNLDLFQGSGARLQVGDSKITRSYSGVNVIKQGSGLYGWTLITDQVRVVVELRKNPKTEQK